MPFRKEIFIKLSQTHYVWNNDDWISGSWKMHFENISLFAWMGVMKPLYFWWIVSHGSCNCEWPWHTTPVKITNWPEGMMVACVPGFVILLWSKLVQWNKIRLVFELKNWSSQFVCILGIFSVSTQNWIDEIWPVLEGNEITDLKPD